MTKSKEKTVESLSTSLPLQLRLCRQKAGLSMREVAKRIHKTAATISKWESGETTPYGDTLLMLCKIYNVDITAFYGVATPQSIRITPAETRLIELYRNATKDAKCNCNCSGKMPEKLILFIIRTQNRNNGMIKI